MNYQYMPCSYNYSDKGMSIPFVVRAEQSYKLWYRVTILRNVRFSQSLLSAKSISRSLGGQRQPG